MAYTAVNLENHEYDQKGFESPHEARKYIEGLVCNICLEDLRVGYVDFEMGGERLIIDNILDTLCGSAWLVISDEDYDASENTTDLFISSGMTPGDENTLTNLTEEQKENLRKKQEEKEE